MDTLSVPAQRLRSMLRTAMGEGLAEALANPAVFEIMVNPDGVVRLDLAGEGRLDTGAIMTAADVERVIRLVASHVHAEVHSDNPIVSAELPLGPDGTGGERFEGLLPPVVSAPCFSIRKPAYRLMTLDTYVANAVMTQTQAGLLRRSVRHRDNILVVGGTSSGKTTLTNALLAEVADLDERVILIEDTRELRCAARDVVALRTRIGFVTMADLVRSTLRLRPDRIIVGEVRGAEALDMLKAWNTGHPGGIATLHANSARGALLRLEQLIQEAVVHVPRPLIAEAIDIIVFICGANAHTGVPRQVGEIMALNGLDRDGNYDLRSALPAGEDHLSLPSIPRRPECA
jgi:type IV secretion system protein TrbB